MEWRIPKYPCLSEQAIGFANRLNRQGLNSLELSASGSAYRLSADTALRSSDFPIAVRCSINGHSVQLGLDAGLCDVLLADWLPLDDLARVSDNLKKAVILAALEPVVDFFSAHSAGSFSVADIAHQSTHPSSTSLFFNLSSHNGAIVGQGFADVDEYGLDILDAMWQASAQSVGYVNVAELPIWFDVATDGITLQAEEFRCLGEGDIILLDVAFADLNEVYVRIDDTISFPSVIDGNKLIVQSREGHGIDGKR